MTTRFALCLVLASSSVGAAQEFALPGFVFRKSPAPSALVSAGPAVAAAAMAPSRNQYPVRGVDVSAHQNDIDWTKVAQQDIAFAYIKATEGIDFVDEKFAANWKGAAAAGIRRGAYHFYSFCDKGAAQAANFVKNVPADADALPPVVDIEVSKDCKKMPSAAAFAKDFKAYVAGIRQAYGQAPVIYVDENMIARYFKFTAKDYRIWIADPGKTPALPGGQSWTFWQYGWHGAVAGIAGDVDVDVFDGSAPALAKLDAPASEPVLMAFADAR